MTQNFWTVVPSGCEGESFLYSRNLVHNDGNSALFCNSTEFEVNYFFLDRIRRIVGGVVVEFGDQDPPVALQVFYSNIEYDRRLINSSDPVAEGLSIYECQKDNFRSVMNGLEEHEDHSFSFTQAELSKFRTIPQCNREKFQARFLIASKNRSKMLSTYSSDFENQSRVIGFRLTASLTE